MGDAILLNGTLDQLQRDTFGYFLEETNPRNGLVADSTRGERRRASPPSGSRWLPTRLAWNAGTGSRPGRGWYSSGYYGIEQGPIVLMIENYRSGFLWGLLKRCPDLATGLRRAGFADGWLSAPG